MPTQLCVRRRWERGVPFLFASATLALGLTAAAAARPVTTSMPAAIEPAPRPTVRNPLYTSPGWRYGGYNCGCFANVNATTASCQSCCQQAGNDPIAPLTPGQVANCMSFCAQLGQPCLPY